MTPEYTGVTGWSFGSANVTHPHPCRRSSPGSKWVGSRWLSYSAGCACRALLAAPSLRGKEDGAMSAPGPLPGDVLAGKYRVERVLGSGGMGIVVLATHIQLEQKVAIKLLLPAALQNVELIRRFVQEARAAARLRGDHVVRVHDVGTLDDGNPYLVMEYLEGEDLDAVVQARGRLPIEEAVDYVLQACEAIA